jgi:hypothetical protein
VAREHWCGLWLATAPARTDAPLGPTGATRIVQAGRSDYKILKARQVGFFAGMPLPKDIDGLSPAELKSLVLRLLKKVAELERTVAAQRDEIAQLRGGPPRPNIKPSGMEQASNPKPPGDSNERRRRSSTRSKLSIDEVRNVELAAPPGARFKGYRSFVVQGQPCTPQGLDPLPSRVPPERLASRLGTQKQMKSRLLRRSRGDRLGRNILCVFLRSGAYIIRPRDRRQSRRLVALSAATDSGDPPFIERRKSCRLRDFVSRRWARCG